MLPWPPWPVEVPPERQLSGSGFFFGVKVSAISTPEVGACLRMAGLTPVRLKFDCTTTTTTNTQALGFTGRLWC